MDFFSRSTLLRELDLGLCVPISGKQEQIVHLSFLVEKAPLVSPLVNRFTKSLFYLQNCDLKRYWDFYFLLMSTSLT